MEGTLQGIISVLPGKDPAVVHQVAFQQFGLWGNVCWAAGSLMEGDSRAKPKGWAGGGRKGQQEEGEPGVLRTLSQ